MKTSTLLTYSALFAVLFGLSITMQAQQIQFTTDYTVSDKLRATHRTVPLWADFNNDDKMDVYYSGTSWKHGWTSGGFLIKNLGGLQLEMDAEFETEIIQVTDYNDAGDSIGLKDQERVVGMKNGLPYSAYGIGSLAFDFNQDGLVDFLFLNRGGNDTGTNKGIYLVKNLGNYQFEVVNDTTLAGLKIAGDNGSSYNEDNEIGSIAVGDYDKDGYTDLLVEGYSTEGGRFVKLLRNVEGNHFELQLVFNPLPFDVEPNKVGVYAETEPTVDDEGVEIPGHFIDTPTMKAKPLSHGSIGFGDFDNDGWLDIVATGYADGRSDPEPQEGGDQFRIYRNLHNGEFKEATDELCSTELPTVNDVYKKWGNEDCVMNILDFNQDGKLDIVFIGSMRDRSSKQAILLMNTSDGGKFAFEEVATVIPPISGGAVRLATCADVNGDGYVDFLYRGWTDYTGINDWRYAVSSSNGSSESYEIDLFNENEHNGAHYCETMSYGDFDGDYLLDAITTDWVEGGDSTYFVRNTTEATVAIPETPAGLVAVAEGSTVKLTWERTDLDNGNEAMYNLYLKNNATGVTRMLVPANAETGYQKAYQPFASYVLSGGESPLYNFENVPAGQYTVGVQAVAYSYAASAFATAQVEVLPKGVIGFAIDSVVSDKLRASHRTVPLWGDFNGNGSMDVYYSGTSYKHGWSSGGFLVKNAGEGSFEMDAAFNDGGGMVNGLPYSAFGLGSLAFDFNQDGLVDFLFLNRGGNDTGTNKGICLVKNLGNYQFETVNDAALAGLNISGDNGSSFNEDNEIGCISLGDYDKDGYTDLLVEGYCSEGRFVKLLRNVEGDHFEAMAVFNPLPYDVEPNKNGIYEQTEGVYSDLPTMSAKPLSHGSVAFGDFDNDGWLDIVACGYADDFGDQVRFYRNMKNGQFQDATDELCNDAVPTVEDALKRWGNSDCVMHVLDYNQDGKLDIIFIGSMRDRGSKQALALINASDGSKFAFEEVATAIPGVSGGACRLATCADLNGDDYVDFLYRGWTDYNGINDWRYAISSSCESNELYNLDLFNDNYHKDGYFCETMSFGDLDGDGLLDAMASNWIDGDTMLFCRNITDGKAVAPQVPAGLTATADGKKVTLSWDKALMNNGNEAMYNLYLKNNTTGALRMLVPAVAETGSQKVYQPFGSYVLSGGEAPSYDFENVPDGQYTVAVQAVSYTYQASVFATAQVVVDGIAGVEKDICSIASEGNTIMVRNSAPAQVKVYTLSGALVATGTTNQKILLENKGVYIVKVNNTVAKIIK